MDVMDAAIGKKNRHSCAVCGVTDESVSYHRFPKEEALRKVWIFRIPVKGFIWKESKRLCNKHFLPTDYKDESSDSNPRRAKTPLKRKTLKAGAIPSIWPNTTPKFHNQQSVTPRSTTLPLPSTRAAIEENKEKMKDEIPSIDAE